MIRQDDIHKSKPEELLLRIYWTFTEEIYMHLYFTNWNCRLFSRVLRTWFFCNCMWISGTSPFPRRSLTSLFHNTVTNLSTDMRIFCRHGNLFCSFHSNMFLSLQFFNFNLYSFLFYQISETVTKIRKTGNFRSLHFYYSIQTSPTV